MVSYFFFLFFFFWGGGGGGGGVGGWGGGVGRVFLFFSFSDQGQSSLHSHSVILNLAGVRNSRIVLKVLAMCLYV